MGFAAINPFWVFDPGSMGALFGIDVQANLDVANSPWALYILQGSNLYRASVATGTGNGVTSSATGLVAASFGLVDLAANTVTPGTPDFSSGFALGFGQRLLSPNATTSVVAFNDISITLNTSGPAAIPEPGTVTLFASAVAAGIWWKRRRSV